MDTRQSPGVTFVFSEYPLYPPCLPPEIGKATTFSVTQPFSVERSQRCTTVLPKEAGATTALKA